MPIDLTGAVAGYLVQLFGDAGIKLVRGPEDQRALQRSVGVAIEVVVNGVNSELRKELRLGLQQCFQRPLRIPLNGNVQVEEALMRAVSDQVDQLSGWVHADTRKPFYAGVPVSPAWIKSELSTQLLEALRRHAARGNTTDLVRAIDTASILRSVDELARQVAGLVEHSAMPGGEIAPFPAAASVLPAGAADFTGRAVELANIVSSGKLLKNSSRVVRIDAINGMAGVGKTALAVHAAHTLKQHYPDHQIFLNLHGHTPGQRPVSSEDALAALLLAIGTDAQEIPQGLEARTIFWQNRVAGVRILLLLDDAASTEQVRPLLPGTSNSIALITSRRRLIALTDSVPISLDVLQLDDAARLLVQLSGRPIEPSDQQVVEVVQQCGYLPLAIGLMGSFLRHHPTWSIDDLAQHLSDRTGRLDALSAEHVSVRAAFHLSYNDLGKEEQCAFKLLGLHPGSEIDSTCAASLIGASLQSTQRLLDSLYQYHLVDETSRGRFRFHDLIREHARDLVYSDPEIDREAALERLLDYYQYASFVGSGQLGRTLLLPTPARTPHYLPPMRTRAECLTWFEAESAPLQALTEQSAKQDLSYAIWAPTSLDQFLRLRGHWDRAIRMHEISRDVARRTGDNLGEGCALHNLGYMLYLTDDYEGSATALRGAATLFGELGQQINEAAAHNRLGAVHRMTGTYSDAIASQERAYVLFTSVGDALGQADALAELGSIYWLKDSYADAIDCQERALALYRGVGNETGEAGASKKLAIVQYLIGKYDEALKNFALAERLYDTLDDRFGKAGTLNERGVALQLMGDLEAATSCQEQSFKLYRDLGDRLGQADALNQLGVVGQTRGDYDTAARQIRQALQTFRDLGNRHSEAEALNNLGGALLLIPITRFRAYEMYEEALVIARGIGARHEEGRALEGTGNYYALEGSKSQAIRDLQLAQELFYSIGSPRAQNVANVIERLK